VRFLARATIGEKWSFPARFLTIPPDAVFLECCLALVGEAILLEVLVRASSLKCNG
jgi:hypothetical protein